jgi:hypothetical protein
MRWGGETFFPLSSLSFLSFFDPCDLCVGPSETRGKERYCSPGRRRSIDKTDDRIERNPWAVVSDRSLRSELDDGKKNRSRSNDLIPWAKIQTDRIPKTLFRKNGAYRFEIYDSSVDSYQGRPISII